MTYTGIYRLLGAAMLGMMMWAGHATAQVAGFTPGEFSVDATGAATYRIPLKVPPGTAGMQPDLALLYHSRAGNGQLGVGWSLSGLSVITRCAAMRDSEGVTHSDGVTLSATDRFCLDGQPLRHQSGTYGAHDTRYYTEIQSFQEVRSLGTTHGAPTRFEVTDRAGLKRHYGQTSDSRITSVGGLSGVPIAWALNRIEDRHGNYISFSYGRDTTNGEYWLADIRWFNRLAEPLGRVLFSYVTTRPDKSFGHGYERTRHALTRRLAHLQIYEGTTTPVRRYVLAYQQGAINDLSYLASVQECAGTGSPCLPPTAFGWEHGEQGFMTTGTKAADASHSTKWLDVNGDGRLDAVIRSSGSIRIYFAENNGRAVSSNIPAGSHLRFDEAVVLDYDADGRMDLLIANTQTGNWDLYLSHGTGLRYVQTPLPHFDAYAKHPVAFDITGNGVPELFFKRYGKLWYYLGADSGGFQAGASGTSWVLSDGQKLLPVEFDGDGRPELLVTADACTVDGSSGGGGTGGIFRIHGNPAEGVLDGDLATQDAMSTTSSTSSTSSATCYETAGPLQWDFTPGISAARRLHRPWPDPGQRRHLRPVPLDIDGDGLTDLVSLDRYTGALIVYLNRGGHWENIWTGLNDTGWDKAVVLDWNHDGRDDLLVRGPNGQFLALTYRNHVIETLATGIGTGANAYLAADHDGDGLADLYSRDGGEWRVWRGRGHRAGHLVRVRNGLEDEIRVSFAALSFDYGGSHAVYRGHEAGDVDTFGPRARHFLGPVSVVESFAADAGIGTSGSAQMIVTRYQYSGAKLNLHGRGFLGFRRVLAHNVNAGIVSENVHLQDFPFTGLVAEAVQRMPDTTTLTEVDADNWTYWYGEPVSSRPVFVTEPGPIVSRSVTTYTAKSLGAPGAGRVLFPHVDATTELSATLEGSGIYKRSHTQYQHDEHGNATSVAAVIDDGAGGDRHTVVTVNTYNHSAHCPGRLTRSVVTQAGPTVGGHGPLERRRTAEFSYYDGAGEHCQLKSETSDAGTPAAMTRSHAYDAFGNRVTETVTGLGISPSRISTTAYDPKGRYPAQVTNAAGHTHAFSWHQGFGRRLSATDANGQTVTRVYDAFGRETRVTGPRSSQYVDVARAWCGTSCQHPDAVLKEIRTGSGVATAQSLSVTELDRLGREVATGERNVQGQVSYALTHFDAAGRPYANSGPFRPGLDAGACWTLRHYDLLGRVRAEFAAAEASHCGTLAPPAPSASPAGWSRAATSYSGLTTTVTDAEGRQRQATLNVMDRLRFVREHDGTTWQQTEYRYDGHGNTSWVQAPGGALTTSVYDDAGRKTSMSDPSMGHWRYGYNAAGELTSQTDAKATTVTMSYDVLGRILTRVEPEGATTWTYDQLAQGAARGRVTNIAGPHGYVERFWYHGAGGELSASARYIGDTWFWSHFDYNALGQLSRIRYPSVNCAAPCSSVPSDAARLRVDHGYRYGHLVQVRERRPDGTAGTIYWEALEVDALGAVTREQLGNTLATMRYVNPATGRVETLATGTAANPVAVQDLGMAWDRVGKLVQRANYRVNRREDLAYDGLGRLTSVTLRTATGGLLATETMTYAPSGNLTAKGPYTHYQYGQTSRPHQVSAVTTPSGARGYTYDANGNLLQVTGPGARTVSWWSFNKPRRMERDANNHTEYWYGPGGDRAMFRQSARVSSQIELILYGSALYERRHIGATIEHTHYIQGNGGAVATVKRTGTSTTNTTRYLHKDHLGSVVAITSESGAIIESLAYDAWGKRRPASTWQTPTPGAFVAAVTLTRGFTLHEHLDQVGLIHMGGRVYDPEIGRFLSPDPFVQFPGSTQGFNRYVYVGNNPLSFTDPSGYFLKELGKAVGIAMHFIPGMQLSNVWLHGFVSGFLASGGNAKAGMMGMMSAGLAGRVGAFADAQALGSLGRSALHGVTQGAIAAAGGGRFGDGALGAFAGSYLSFIPEAVAGPYGSGGEWAKIGRMTAAAAVGGTASKIGGGKFANGAWSAAFVSRFNHENPGIRRLASRQARASLGSGDAVELSAGAYPIMVDSISASFGPVAVESGDLWLFDQPNDRVLHFRYHSIGGGIGLGASVSRHYGVLGLESATDVTGVAVAFRVDGVPGVGGGGSFFSGLSSFSPGTTGGLAIGVHAGLSLSAGHMRFLRSYARGNSPIKGWSP